MLVSEPRQYITGKGFFFYTRCLAACFSGEMWFNWKQRDNMRSEDESQLQACQIRNPI